MRSVSTFLLATFIALPTLGQEMQYPLAVCVKEKTIFVADRNLPGIWKITDGKAEVFFKGQKKFRTPLNAIRCLAIDHEGKLLAGCSATREIYRFGDDGKPVPLTKGKVLIPTSIAVAKDGTIYTADLDLMRIWKIPAAGGEPKEFCAINSPRGLAFDKDERLWILTTSSKDGQIQRADKDGKLETVVAGRPFRMPHNIVVMDDGTAYVSDNYAGAIWKVPAGGKPEKFVGGAPLKKPVGLVRFGNEMLIADPHAKSVFATDKGKVANVLKK